MTIVEAEFTNPFGAVLWDRISFVPYVNESDSLQYVVAIHRDISAQREVERQVDQVHAMRTTSATVGHVVGNFMNAAQLYSSCVAAGQPVDGDMQRIFDGALQKTRSQLTALSGMTLFERSPDSVRHLAARYRRSDVARPVIFS